MRGQNHVADPGRTIAVSSGIDEDLFSVAKERGHGIPADSHATATTQEPERQALEPVFSKDRVHYPAVYHSTERSLVAQKMSWISLMAAIRLSA